MKPKSPFYIRRRQFPKSIIKWGSIPERQYPLYLGGLDNKEIILPDEARTMDGWCDYIIAHSPNMTKAIYNIIDLVGDTFLDEVKDYLNRKYPEHLSTLDKILLLR